MSYEIQPKGEYSPKLKRAMKEIREIMTREDIGGLVVLNDGEGHGEYGLFLEDPSWSNIKFLSDGSGVRTKFHMKSKPKETAMTANMICNQLELVVAIYCMLDKIRSTFAKYVEEQPGGEIRPHQEGDSLS